MFSKLIKSLLPVVVCTAGNFCFAQMNSVEFILDTTNHNTVQYSYETEIYDHSIIRCKTFTILPARWLRLEFIRIDDSKYYCIEYDSLGIKTSEGVARLDKFSYELVKIPVYDSLGMEVGFDTLNRYKFHKDEYWRENICDAVPANDVASTYATAKAVYALCEMESPNKNYLSGKYVNGLKDSIWRQLIRGFTATNYLYECGTLVKQDKINFAGSSQETVIPMLTKKWAQMDDVTSLTEMRKFVPDDNLAAKLDYIEFKKNGFFIWPSRSIKCRWQLCDDGKFVELHFKNETTKIQIDYISDKNLNLVFDAEFLFHGIHSRYFEW